MSGRRVVRFSGHGRTVDQEARARRCIGCTPAHFITPGDAVLAAAGARVLQVPCPGAMARLEGQMARIAEDERQTEQPCR